VLYVRFSGRDARKHFAPDGPGKELIVEMGQRGQRPLWEAGNPDDVEAIEAIREWDNDDRYIVVQVTWEFPVGLLRLESAYVVAYYRYDRHGKEPWSPLDRGVLIKPTKPRPNR
jgi:hypothetical protein